MAALSPFVLLNIDCAEKFPEKREMKEGTHEA